MTNYKKLSSYFLTREGSSGLTGYYYGSSDPNALPEGFNSIKVDRSFNIDKIVGAKTSGEILSIKVQEDGKILIGGHSGGTGFIARITPDGELDQEFSRPLINSGMVRSIDIQKNGKIILGGSFTQVSSTTRNRIARLNPNGTLDIGFNPNANNEVRQVKVDSKDRILLSGPFTTIGGTARNRIARLTDKGSLDSFNPSCNDLIFKILETKDARSYIFVGNFTQISSTTRNFIARVNEDGSLDSSGFTTYPSSSISDIAELDDGSFIVVGDFLSYNGLARNRIAKIGHDGALDPTIFTPDITGGMKFVKIQKDKKIVVGGSFDGLAGVATKYLGRFNSDGTIDKNFIISNADFNPSGLNQAPSDIAILPNNEILFAARANRVFGIYRDVMFKFIEVVSTAPYRLAYSVPENTSAIVKKIFIANHNEFPVFTDIAIVPYAESNTEIKERHHYIWDSLIEENNFKEINSQITLSAGDEIHVYSSTDENISYNFFGVEL